MLFGVRPPSDRPRYPAPDGALPRVDHDGRDTAGSLELPKVLKHHTIP
jgi:hypothetical protein